MTEHRVSLRMPYFQAYKLYRGRNELGVLHSENVSIIVREVDPIKAPIAYRVHTQDDYVLDRHREVRSFESTFWWPLMAHDGPFSVSRFVEFAASGKLGSFLAFDGPLKTGQRDGRTFEEFERAFPTHRYGECDKEHQSLLTSRGAERLVFCDGYIYVNVGAPVWYVAEKPTLGRVDVWLGHEALDHAKTHVRTGGPGKHLQHYCCEFSRAYGLSEIATEIKRLADPHTEVRFRSRLEVVLDLDIPERAARLCARTLFGTIRHCVHDEALRAAVPLLAETANMKAPTDSDLFRVLEQYARFKDRSLTQGYWSSIKAARDIVRRLKSLGCTPLAQEDDDALAALGS